MLDHSPLWLAPNADSSSRDKDSRYTEHLRIQIMDLEQELFNAQCDLEDIREESVRMQQEMFIQTEGRLKDTQNHTSGVMVLALHMAERESRAAALGNLVLEAVTHLEALLSDAPEPTALDLFAQLRKAVEDLSSPPSERVKKMLEDLEQGEP